VNIFTFENAKTSKGESLGYLTAIRYLAPHYDSGLGVNVCPRAGACVAACLYTAGRAAIFAQINETRRMRTAWRLADKAAHMDACREEIRRANERARRAGLTLVVRPNGTSDLVGDSVELAEDFPSIQFYDYTKVYSHALSERIPSNLHVTLSYDPVTVPLSMGARALSAGINVAVPFAVARGHDLPTTYRGARVIDGDLHDLRFLDPRGVVVGLRAKGKARSDASGFVVKVES
jgi:hypothetical protein